MFGIGLLIGLFVGAIVGLFVSAFLVARKDGDKTIIDDADKNKR